MFRRRYLSDLLRFFLSLTHILCLFHELWIVCFLDFRSFVFSESVQFDKTMFLTLICLIFFTIFTLEISSMSKTTTMTTATAQKFTNYSRRNNSQREKIIPIRILLLDVVVVDDDDDSVIWPMDLDSEIEIREFLSNLNATEQTF